MGIKKPRSEVARDSISTLSTNVIGAILAALSSLILTSCLAPEQKGLITMTQLSGTTLVTLFSLSVNSAIIFYTSRHQTRHVRRALTRISLVLTGFILIAGLFCAVFLRNFMYKNLPAMFIGLSILYAVFSFVSSVFLSILRGENRFSSYNIIILIQRILTIIFSLAIIFWRYPVIMVLANLLIMLVMIALSIFVMVRVRYETPLPPEDDVDIPASKMVKYSLKSHASNVMSYVNSIISTYILNGLSPDTSNAGIYSFAYTLIEQLWLLPNAVSMVIMSRIAAMKVNEDKVRLTVMSCKIVTYITMLCAVLMLIAVQFLVPIFFPKYVLSITPMKILVVGSILITYAKVLANSIAAYGRPELNVISTAVGVVVNIIMGIILIPRFGINGTAMTTSLSLTVQGAASIIIFCKYTKTPIHTLLFPTKHEISLLVQMFRHKGKGKDVNPE